MELFIANTTKQHNDFLARIPERNRLHHEKIPAGGQIKIGDLDADQIEAIVEQHRRYGMVEARTVDRKTFVGLMYSIGRPVDAGQIEEGLNDNDQALTDKASDMRAGAIAAANESLRQQAEENGGDAGSVSVEIIEQKNPNDPNSSPSFNQRIDVSTDTKEAIVENKGKRK